MLIRFHYEKSSCVLREMMQLNTVSYNMGTPRFPCYVCAECDRANDV